MHLRPVFRPSTLLELSIVECMLEGADIPCYVHNRYTFSVFGFPRVEGYSDCAVFVAPVDFDDASALLAEFISNFQTFDLDLRSKVRVVIEAWLTGQFLPNRSHKYQQLSDDDTSKV
jgi:hypothetical protein